MKANAHRERMLNDVLEKFSGEFLTLDFLGSVPNCKGKPTITETCRFLRNNPEVESLGKDCLGRTVWRRTV